MKLLKNRIIQSLLLAISLSFNGCSLFVSKVKVDVPSRPAYAECPAKPDIRGKIDAGTVVMQLEDAVKLRDWIAAYQICAESNRVIADGHIEKLENRLKAISQ